MTLIKCIFRIDTVLFQVNNNTVHYYVKRTNWRPYTRTDSKDQLEYFQLFSMRCILGSIFLSFFLFFLSFFLSFFPSSRIITSIRTSRTNWQPYTLVVLQDNRHIVELKGADGKDPLEKFQVSLRSFIFRIDKILVDNSIINWYRTNRQAYRRGRWPAH